MVSEVRSGGKLLARLLSAGGWQAGLQFLSTDEEFLQVGTWRYDAGRRLPAHVHNTAPRTVTHTQEFVFVQRGRLTAHIFDDGGNPVEDIELGAGDMLVLLAGGHGYTILDDDTRVIEVKNGPYLGADVDRRRL